MDYQLLIIQGWMCCLLKPEQNAYKQLIENLPDAFARHQVVFGDHGNPVDFIFLDLNSTFEEMTGQKRGALIGKRVSEAHPQVKESAYSWLGDYNKPGKGLEPLRFEIYSEPLKRWYDVQAYSEGSGFLTTVFHDITAHKELVYELQRNQKSLKHLANNIPDMVARFDTNLRHIYINQTASQALGIPAEIFIGNSFKDLCSYNLPPELTNQLQAMHSALEKCLASCEEQHYADSFTLPEGEKHLLTRIVPERKKGGEIVSLLAITTDITDRVNDEKRNSAIAKLILALNEQSSINDALRLCLDTALSVTAFDSGGIYLFDESSSTLKLAAHHGLSDSFIESVSLIESESPSMDLIIAGVPLYKEYSKVGVPLDPVRQSESLLAVAIVPVVYSQKIIACFNVASHSRSTIPEPDKTTMETIASQVGGFIARLLAEEALRESETQFRQITENMIDVVWLRSADNSKMIYISPSYEQVWGRSCQSLYANPQSFMDTVYAEDMEKVKAEFGRYLKSELFDLEYRIKRPDGDLRWVRARSYPVRNCSGAIVRHAGIAVDITERKTAEDELLFMSRHDQLTRLYSRFHFEQLISEPLQADTLPLCVVMADLNGLKMVNDSHGTHLGDEMLKKAALIIRQTCRDEDIIARWGGDEFAILIPKSTAKQADALIKKIAKSCKGQFIEDIPLSMTMGVAYKTDTTGDLFLTLREAENNLARQKLTEARSARHAVLQALLKTLAAKSYETEAHTQRMQQVAHAIGEKVNLSAGELSRLNLLINLHDIGKINITEAILTKQEALSDDEWQSIKTHPEVGYRIARATDEFAHVAEDILAHHERWNGSGYPRGLKGEEIPLLSRITALADAFEVMSNGRPYKEKMSKAEIRSEFENCKGRHFDPVLTELFLTILEGEEETVGS
jgi:diguanylate cyclase (GGDEF)-like protein/PAS domain S-box-containing protein